MKSRTLAFIFAFLAATFAILSSSIGTLMAEIALNDPAVLYVSTTLPNTHSTAPPRSLLAAKGKKSPSPPTKKKASTNKKKPKKDKSSSPECKKFA